MEFDEANEFYFGKTEEFYGPDIPTLSFRLLLKTRGLDSSTCSELSLFSKISISIPVDIATTPIVITIAIPIKIRLFEFNNKNRKI
ncbi:hypothetical protein NSED_09975 [Candidatus Nitrosopumilus sediminis]|uniref:Uncharacterized protein n=1 Tax=Candidatus Nitrosopumilus sediminis TaxID=1229909 RepID=K0BHK0_9ARCH|nr:hypothetical protein NSED_09975 [Candidatus Nitrosopumilus sediminis]